MSLLTNLGAILRRLFHSFRSEGASSDLGAIIGHVAKFLGVAATIYVSSIAASAMLGSLVASFFEVTASSNKNAIMLLDENWLLSFFLILAFSAWYGILAQALKAVRGINLAKRMLKIRLVAQMLIGVFALAAILVLLEVLLDVVAITGFAEELGR